MKLKITKLLLLFSLMACSAPTESSFNPKPEIEKALNENLLAVWYPKTLDTTFGGYYTTFDYQWKKTGSQDKFIVTQARHVWTLSFVYEHHSPQQKYLDYARQGFHFLKNKLWDNERGGFFQTSDSAGNVAITETNQYKTAYGNAFAIYALAQYYKVSQDSAALELAKKTFLWLDKYARDPGYDGYFQVLNRDGSPLPRSQAASTRFGEKALIGLKEFNSSIHLLEAFTTLYQVWPDDLVRSRLEEMYHIVSETMRDERGFLKLYFYPDWTLVPDGDQEALGASDYYQQHVTFGHDVETAFLLYEAAEALHLDMSDLLPKIKRMVDHALDHGWDTAHGGFFDQGKYQSHQLKITNRHKAWWAQAEGLNALLLMHKLFPNDERNYYGKFEQMWIYIDQYLIDHENGDWYVNGLDSDPNAAKAPKAQAWKGNYHTARALIMCQKMLEEMGK